MDLLLFGTQNVIWTYNSNCFISFLVHCSVITSFWLERNGQDKTLHGLNSILQRSGRTTFWHSALDIVCAYVVPSKVVPPTHKSKSAEVKAKRSQHSKFFPDQVY